MQRRPRPIHLVREHPGLAAINAPGGLIEAAMDHAQKPLTPGEASLASRIVEVVENDQEAKHPGRHHGREVVNALAAAAARLLSRYSAHMPAGCDLIQELDTQILAEMQRLSGPAPRRAGGKVH